MKIILRCFLAISTVSALNACEAFSDTPTAAAMDAETIIQAIRENAERLKSGSFIATGTFEHRLGNSGPTAHAPGNDAPPQRVHVYQEKISCEFDFNRDLFSFRRWREPVGDTPNPPWNTFGYVSTRARAMLIKDVGDNDLVAVEIHEPTFFPKDHSDMVFQPINDPRAMGFAGLLKWHGRYPELADYYFPVETGEVIYEGTDIWRFERTKMIDKRGNGNRRIWWCDLNKGLQPVSYRFALYKDPSLPVASIYNQSIQPIEESQVGWSLDSDVWVPTSIDCFARSGQRELRMTLELDWETVNGPVSDEAFEWKTWKLPVGSVVSDYRLHGDTPVRLDVVGHPMEIALIPLQEDRKQGHWLWFTVFAINALVLGGILGFLIGWSRKRENRERSELR